MLLINLKTGSAHANLLSAVLLLYLFKCEPRFCGSKVNLRDNTAYRTKSHKYPAENTT